MPYISRNPFNKEKLTKNKFAIIIISNIENSNKLITNLQNLLNNYTTNYLINIIDSNHNLPNGYLYNIGFNIAKEHNCKFVIFHSAYLNPTIESIGNYLTYPIDPIIFHSLSKTEFILSININNFERFNKFSINSLNILNDLTKYLKKNKINLNYSAISSYNIIDNKVIKKKNKQKINNTYKIKLSIKINKNTNYYLIK